jgi:hypothetical protein
VKEGKAVFFEKKNQRTFTHGVRHPVQKGQSCAARNSKVFWFFFSKKNCFLTFRATYAE